MGKIEDALDDLGNSIFLSSLVIACGIGDLKWGWFWFALIFLIGAKILEKKGKDDG